MEELSLREVLTFTGRSGGGGGGRLEDRELCVCVCVCVCVWGVPWYQKERGNMQVRTSHYPVACVLSLIHCYRPRFHLSSFTLLILCLPHLTSLSLSLSLTHTHAHTHSHWKRWVFRQTKPPHTTIFIHLTCSRVLNLEWGKLFYKILLIHYLPFFPFVCPTHHSFVLPLFFEHEHGGILLQDVSWNATNSFNHWLCCIRYVVCTVFQKGFLGKVLCRGPCHPAKLSQGMIEITFTPGH